jgi:hypothetical protein
MICCQNLVHRPSLLAYAACVRACQNLDPWSAVLFYLRENLDLLLESTSPGLLAYSS